MSGTTELGAIERGWREYNAAVLPSAESEGVRMLVRLGYYAGAAQALSQLGHGDETDWAAIVERLALEVCDATDRLVLASMLGRMPR